MADDTERKRRLWDRIRECLTWSNILDFAYVTWILRAPLVVLAVGLLVLGLAPQAQDLIVDLAAELGRMVLFLALLIAWVWVTIFCSYLLLERDRRLRAHADQISQPPNNPRAKWLRRSMRGMPYLLGAIPFVIVLIATIRSGWNLPDIEDINVLDAVRASLAVFLAVLGLFFLVFLVYATGRPRRLVEPVAAYLSGLKPWLPGISWVLLIVVSVVSMVILIAGPTWSAAWLPRALIIPVLLGGWLPLLALLSGLGRRWQAPLIAGVLMLAAGLSALFGDNHSVRRIGTADVAMLPPPGAAVPNYAPMTLNQALELWMEENGCKGEAARCPRPIIIAGAGGASRAGFFTASMVGHIMDRASYYVPGPYPALDETAVRKRIFAISGVSGSAVGAVMTVAAMAKAGPDTKQPCVRRKPPLWYGGEINNWRDCLEALMAGDFLTPVVIGLVFNDRSSFGWWRDRAAVLEQSWEDRFAELTSLDADWQSHCPGDLRCPFMTLQPQRGHWLPLLVLNGTSVATGRRIITSILEPNFVANECPTRAPIQAAVEAQSRARPKQVYASDASKSLESECSLFLESNRFHLLLANDYKPDLWTRVQLFFLRESYTKRILDDVRLSTAAHNSARFPIISPPGAVRNRRHQVIDRIVDGGYIENFGALTAMEIAQAIHAIEPELAPFVLAVSNDPDSDPDINPLDAPESALLSDIVIPIHAIASARTGHGRLAMGQVDAVLDHLALEKCGAQTAHVRVWPQFAVTNSDRKVSRPVSMSWWLSTPIQIHLHQQTELRKNQNQNDADLGKIWSALDKPVGCVGRPVAPSAAEIQLKQQELQK